MADSIRILTTGGTIDKVYFDALSEFQVGDPAVAEILKESLVNVSYEVQSICRKDSLELDDKDREEIVSTAQACLENRIVITHGTDTMIQTARCLQRLTGKVIVLTGSMAPAKLRNSDAYFNIGGAIIAVQTLPAGVYILMNGRILHPDRVVKNRQSQRFEES